MVNKKHRHRNAIYSLYDSEDNLVAVGEIADICRKCDVVKSTITKALDNGSLLRRRYHIYAVEDDDE